MQYKFVYNIDQNLLVIGKDNNFYYNQHQSLATLMGMHPTHAGYLYYDQGFLKPYGSSIGYSKLSSQIGLSHLINDLRIFTDENGDIVIINFDFPDNLNYTAFEEIYQNDNKDDIMKVILG